MSIGRFKSPPARSEELLEFRYRPLRSSVGIRLAQIHPGSGTKGINITLIEDFVHGGRTTYDALSYTWGSTTRLKFVTCNRRRLAITETLLAALQRFRHESDTVTFWIDQICIDQDNNEERNQQVSMMGKIFGGARKVVAWFGEEAEDSKAGLQAASNLLRVMARYPGMQLNNINLESHGLPKPGHKRWQALGAVLRRPWFSRVWVIQEVVLSSRVEVACGQVTLSWEEMEQLIYHLDCPSPNVSNAIGTTVSLELPFKRINRIRARHQLAGLDQKQDDKTELFDLLLVSRDFGATNPRDNIYAFLELGEHNVNPDYDKDVRDIFMDLAAHTVSSLREPSCTNTYPATLFGPQYTGSSYASEKYFLNRPRREDKFFRPMIMLSCAGVFNQSLSLPSFVPDWTVDSKVRPFCFWGSEKYHAGGDALPEMSLHPKSRLAVCGKIFDTVRLAGCINLDLSEPADAKEKRARITAWFDEGRAMAAGSHSPYPAGMSSFVTPTTTAYDRILRWNELSGVEAALDSSNPTYATFIEYLECPQGSTPNSYHSSLMGVAVGRVSFLTAGGYMGLAPYGIQDGDVVFAALGGDIPFVLRPVGEEFVLLGECYVYGIMGGQVMLMEELPVQDVLLR
ncbi:hypothetical protein LTR16_002130 [Cryomyces antarcticus]|uniref:Heterokaryon incompatibility domain-containing protein n=1 Tax=Cryomyces antarcticus TaxID=329879 RepID=A0ABR0LPP5_9PEZI|nr:hypothetical protein LTR16_002130 [Cryomyces antarcticus]